MQTGILPKVSQLYKIVDVTCNTDKKSYQLSYAKICRLGQKLVYVELTYVVCIVAVQSVGNVRLYEKNTMRNIGCKKTLMRLHKKLDFIYRKMVNRQLDKLP